VPTVHNIHQSQVDSHVIKFCSRGEKEIQEYTIEEFKIATGISYIPGLEFQTEIILKRIQEQCAHALEIGTIGAQSRWLGTLHAEQIRSHTVAEVSIRWIDETIGYGLFAEKDIQPWEYIGEYAGVVRKCNLIFGNTNEYCFGYPTSMFSFRKHLIDAREKGNELRYANHSESPNSESIGAFCDDILHIVVRAIKHIPAGTQIMYDYTGLQRFSMWGALRQRVNVFIPASG